MQYAAGLSLTDRDICTELLYGSKHLAFDYAIAEAECASPHLRQSLHQMHHEESQFQQRVFQYMHQRGWYDAPVADYGLRQQVASLWSQKLTALRSAGFGQAASYGTPYHGYGSGQPYGYAAAPAGTTLGTAGGGTLAASALDPGPSLAQRAAGAPGSQASFSV